MTILEYTNCLLHLTYTHNVDLSDEWFKYVYRNNNEKPLCYKISSFVV